MAALSLQGIDAERASHWPDDSWRADASVQRARAATVADADARLLALERAFRWSGGMVSADELARLLRGRVEQPLSTVARWIVAREVVNVEWRSQTMLPLFQFDLRDATLRVPVAAVVRELAVVFDDWDLVCWFAEPNAWLGGALPARLVEAHASAVLAAARADRFIARG
jgi:hypothetical protein